jgi:hypothetical protein
MQSSLLLDNQQFNPAQKCAGFFYTQNLGCWAEPQELT